MSAAHIVTAESSSAVGNRPGLRMHEVPCPLCGSTHSSKLMEGPDWYYDVPGVFVVVRCAECGHSYLNPCPVDEDLARCYPSGYSAHRSGQPGAEPAPATPAVAKRPWYLAGWFRKIPGPRWLYYWLTDAKSQYVPPGPAGRRALEMGCATGDFLLRLKQEGWEAEGVDIVESAVEVARSRGFNVQLGDPTTVELPSVAYDAVFAWMVVEHLPRPQQAVEKAMAALQPGGWFCFSVPNFASWERRLWGSHWKGADLPRHLQHFTPAILKSLLANAGFTDIRIMHQPSFLNWLGSHGSWLKARNAESRLGEKLLRWFYDNPPLWTYFVFGPWANLSAALKQGGRLTVLTRKPVGERR